MDKTNEDGNVSMTNLCYPNVLGETLKPMALQVKLNTKDHKFHYHYHSLSIIQMCMGHWRENLLRQSNQSSKQG